MSLATESILYVGPKRGEEPDIVAAADKIAAHIKSEAEALAKAGYSVVPGSITVQSDREMPTQGWLKIMLKAER